MSASLTSSHCTNLVANARNRLHCGRLPLLFRIDDFVLHCRASLSLRSCLSAAVSLVDERRLSRDRVVFDAFLVNCVLTFLCSTSLI